MMILALDQKYTDGTWRKKWGSLCEDIIPVDCDSPASGDINKIISPDAKAVLILLHMEPCANRDVSKAWLANINARHALDSSFENFFIMYVRGGSGLNHSSNDYWIHYANTPVNTNVDLSHLQSKFSTLVENLRKATTPKDVLSAWKEFDKSALAVLLELVAPIFMDDSLPVFSAIKEHLMRMDADWRKRAADGARAMKLDAEAIIKKAKELATNGEREEANKLANLEICLNDNTAEDIINYMIRNRDIVNSIARRFL